MKRLLLFAPLATLTGCAATSQVPPPTIVKVPVPVACVSPDFPKEPVYPDTLEALRAAASHDEFDRLMQAGWVLRYARSKAVEAEIERCRKP